MKFKHILLIVVSILLFSQAGNTQTEADKLINAIREKSNSIQSFEVQATIHVDVEFINIKDRQVKINYEAPDQFDFDAEGLLLLPKSGVQMEYMTLLNEEFTAIEAGTDNVRDVFTKIIKVIPEALESDIILAQLWIDPEENRIMRMKTFTRSSGSYLVDFEYKNPKDLMPMRLEVVFEMGNMSVPMKMMTDFMSKNASKEEAIPDEARVIIEYSDYNITLK